MLESGGGGGDFYARVKITPARTPTRRDTSPVGEAFGGSKTRLRVPQFSGKTSRSPTRRSCDLSLASLDHVLTTARPSPKRRLLRKGGVLVLTLNNRRSWWKAVLSRTAYLRRREEEIAREHYFQWSFSECESHLAEFVPVRRIYTTTFVPYVPHLWRPLLPASDLFGRPLLRKYGANIIALCRKPGEEA